MSTSPPSNRIATMMRHALAAVALALLAARSAAAQQSHDITPYLMTDRAAEVALARSAAPARLSDSATVLVLTRTGYVEAAHGTNGFTCLVSRSFSGGLDDPKFWSPSVRAPQCLNPPAVQTVLPAMLRQVDWVISGLSNAEVASRIDQGYASHQFPQPAPGAISFMLSREQHLADENPHWMPHLMFFYDKSLPPAQLGAGDFKSAMINGSAADAHAPVLTIFVPVREWSDGTTAMRDATHQE